MSIYLYAFQNDLSENGATASSVSTNNLVRIALLPSNSVHELFETIRVVRIRYFIIYSGYYDNCFGNKQHGRVRGHLKRPYYPFHEQVHYEAFLQNLDNKMNV